MKIINSIYKTMPVIIHRPGKNWHEDNCECSINCKFWKKINKIFFKKKFYYSFRDDVTFITWNNKKDKQILEKCLDHLNFNYICLGKNIVNWNNTLKILTLCDYIKNIKTKYVFGLDSFDVFFLGDLESCLENFNNLKCEMIFNSTPKKFPEYSNGLVEEKLAPKDSSSIYLNAGCWVAKSEFLLNIIYNLKKYVLENPHEKSEQYFMRKIFIENHNYIKIDYHMNIFQSGFFDKILFNIKL